MSFVYIFSEKRALKERFPIVSCLDFPAILSKTKNGGNDYYHERTAGNKH